MKEQPTVPAFKEKLVPHLEHGHKTRDDTLLQLENRADIVIRPLRWIHMLEKRRWHAKESGEVTAEEFASLTKRHFDELRVYGINAPVSFVVADSASPEHKLQEEVFAIVDNIHPAEHPDRAAMGEAYATMRNALLRYYTDAYDGQKSFLADLVKDQQYVYGQKSGDTENALYLIDITPYIYWSPHVLRLTLVNLVSRIRSERDHFQNASFEPIMRGAQHLIERIDLELNSSPM